MTWWVALALLGLLLVPPLLFVVWVACAPERVARWWHEGVEVLKPGQRR